MNLTKQRDLTPEEERAYREFLRQWDDLVADIQDDIVRQVRNNDVDLDELSELRAEISNNLGNYTEDIQVLFREHTEGAAVAGRRVAARRHQLDVAFDVVPEETLDELYDWAVDLSHEVTENMADDMAQYLRSAYEEGLSIPDIANDLNDEFFDQRLRDWKAEQLARDNTIAPSNAGAHTAHQEAEGVVAEQWVATGDDRTRETHADAHGQVVAVDNTFVVGGYEAEHPGDTSLPVGEFTHCRCTVVPVFADELTEDQLEAIQSGERLWLTL